MHVTPMFTFAEREGRVEEPLINHITTKKQNANKILDQKKNTGVKL